MKNTVDRREFVGGLAAAGLIAALPGCARAQDGPPVVVIVHAAGVAKLTGEEQGRRMRQMLSAGMTKLTGLEGEAAWQSIFKPEDVVALKVNALAPTIGTRATLAESVARGVLRAGVKPNQVLVWDRFEHELAAAGYTLGESDRGFRVVATDNQGGYDAAPSSNGSVNQKLCQIISSQATAIVNMPVLKDHNLAGLTGALKNHFGSIDEPWKLHGEGINQAIADLNALPAIRDRHRLVVCDATTVVYEGGPTDQPKYRVDLDSILIARDPVAHDAVGLQIIEQLRRENALRPLARSGRPVTCLALAEQAGIGVGDVEKITIERVEVE